MHAHALSWILYVVKSFPKLRARLEYKTLLTSLSCMSDRMSDEKQRKSTFHVCDYSFENSISFSTLDRKMYHMDLWDSGFLSFIWYVKEA